MLIARTVLRWPDGQPIAPNLGPASPFVAQVLAADFTLMFGLDVLGAARAPRVAGGFAEWMAHFGLLHARAAYAALCAPLYTQRGEAVGAGVE